MPKSKEFVEDSDSDDTSNARQQASLSDDETETKPAAKKAKTAATTSKTQPAAKRAKPSADSGDSAVASKTGQNGERLYEIGRMRYISVSEFRGKPYVNIREYYDDKGVEKPGKKGISLAGDQWEKLKSLINQVDNDLKHHR